MNIIRKIKGLFRYPSVILFASCLCFGFLATSALGQGRPFTDNQFPLWFATQSVQAQAISNANEIVLFQTTVPRNIMGNFGYLKFTIFAGSPDATAATVTHSIKCYLGGTNANNGAVWGANGLTPGTPVFTNTTTTTTSTPISSWLFPNNSATTNFVWSTTTTNFLVGLDSRRQITYGTQTNGILLTITGVTAGPGSAGPTNIVNLDAVILEALGVN